jgi:hypothetical protein
MDDTEESELPVGSRPLTSGEVKGPPRARERRLNVVRSGRIKLDFRHACLLAEAEARSAPGASGSLSVAPTMDPAA